VTRKAAGEPQRRIMFLGDIGGDRGIVSDACMPFIGVDSSRHTLPFTAALPASGSTVPLSDGSGAGANL
jgi:hypothetical protein